MLTKTQIETAKGCKLSANFSLYELINSSGHPELVVWPTDEVIEHLREYAKTVLQPIRDKFGPMQINSGYRNTSLNSAVGGETNSVHQIIYRTVFLGVASDIVPLEADLTTVYLWAFDNIQEIKTAIIYRKPAVTKTKFIHLDTRSNRSGRALLEKFGASDYRNYER